MLSAWIRTGLAVSALAFMTTPVWADTYQVNPSAIGAPQASFVAGLADFSYTATVDQTSSTGCATGVCVYRDRARVF